MELTERQKQIIEIVKNNEPISGDNIASELNLSKSTLRSDLAVLTMIGILDARPKVGYIFSGLDFEPFIQEKLSTLVIDDIMAPSVIIGQDTSIRDAVTTLFMYDVGTLFVVDDQNELTGIVSRKDLLRSMTMSNNLEAAVALIMTRMPNIYVTHPDMPALAAAKLISRHEIDTLPVVKEKGSKEIIGKYLRQFL